MIPLLALVLTGALAAAPPERAFLNVTDPSTRKLFGDVYPLEATGRFHASLLHFLDSLAALGGPGMTAGKTVESHREAYRRVRGADPAPKDLQILARFRAARLAYARENPLDPNGFTMAFFEAKDLKQALSTLRERLDPKQMASVTIAMRHFGQVYRAIWRDGMPCREFVGRALRARQRSAVARFLKRVAAFYDVALHNSPPPRILVMPVPKGNGTHAQAVDRYLLLEVRRAEGLIDQLAPIVHENAHFLHNRMSAERQEQLRGAAARRAPWGTKAWDTLREALPTAIAQGVAGERFDREHWSREAPWYHTAEIDAYAKRLFPLVKETLATEATFDEAFLNRALALYLMPQSP